MHFDGGSRPRPSSVLEKQPAVSAPLDNFEPKPQMRMANCGVPLRTYSAVGIVAPRLDIDQTNVSGRVSRLHTEHGGGRRGARRGPGGCSRPTPLASRATVPAAFLAQAPPAVLTHGVTHTLIQGSGFGCSTDKPVSSC